MKTIIFGVLAVFLLVSPGYADSHIPLPDDLKIFPPEENIPEKYARFSGTWNGGKWSEKLPHTLVIEEVDSEGHVVAVYAWGDYRGWNLDKGWTRHEGVISGDKLKLEEFSNGANVSYRINSDGSLDGKYVNRRRNTFTVHLSKSE